MRAFGACPGPWRCCSPMRAEGLTRKGSPESQMTVVGFLIGRGFGLVVEMGCAVVDCKAATDSLETSLKLLAIARACAAAAHLESSLLEWGGV